MPLYSLNGSAPQLPEGDRYFVAPTASLIGQVILEEDASVWWGAVLRGDNEPITIGSGSNVQDLCMAHTDPGFPLVIGSGCTIGHSAIIHGCTVGDNSLIGMGATLLNGCRIGKNSIVGANALVTEGKEFPDNSLIIGSPAKVVRTLDAEAVAGIARSAQVYVSHSAHYRNDLVPVG